MTMAAHGEVSKKRERELKRELNMYLGMGPKRTSLGLAGSATEIDTLGYEDDSHEETLCRMIGACKHAKTCLRPTVCRWYASYPAS